MVMLKNSTFAVITVSLLLLFYVVLLQTGWLAPLAGLVYALSPLLMLWLVYTVIRYGRYSGKELQQDEEWGYQDRNNDELGIF